MQQGHIQTHSANRQGTSFYESHLSLQLQRDVFKSKTLQSGFSTFFPQDALLIAEALVISWMQLKCIPQSPNLSGNHKVTGKASLIALIVLWFHLAVLIKTQLFPHCLWKDLLSLCPIHRLVFQRTNIYSELFQRLWEMINCCALRWLQKFCEDIATVKGRESWLE